MGRFSSWFAWGGKGRSSGRTLSRRRKGPAALKNRQHRVEPLEVRELLAIDLTSVNYLLPRIDEYDVARGHITEARNEDPLVIVQDYIQARASAWGLSQDTLNSLSLVDRYSDADTGVTHIQFAQVQNSLALENASLKLDVNAQGEIVNVAGQLVPNLIPRPLAPALSAESALAYAAVDLGLTDDLWPTIVKTIGEDVAQTTVLEDTDLSTEEIVASLDYRGTPTGAVLTWQFNLQTPSTPDVWQVNIDASGGNTVGLTNLAKSATYYNVFPLPLKSPDDGQQTLVRDPFDAVASPYGWHDRRLNGVAMPEYRDTRGNNVFAQDDMLGNDDATIPPRPQSDLDYQGNLQFNAELDKTRAPRDSIESSITQLFYTNNMLHDIHYRYGFDEAAGNFQEYNYSGATGGGDAVRADALDALDNDRVYHFDNAYFVPTPDGRAPRMAMFAWDKTGPGRDGSFDSEIVIHEYGHGVSYRLADKTTATGLNAQQSGCMGEGWSDFWSLMFTQQAGDTKWSKMGVGTYVEGQPEDGAGIRRHPYSFDMSIQGNPITMADYNANPEVHAAGEIWASALWDLNWLLIDRYGFDPDIAKGYDSTKDNAGNIIALQLVMDGLKLVGRNPSFSRARDMILQADANLTGGANQDLIWQAFARRGMGLSMRDYGAGSTWVDAAFDVPQDPYIMQQRFIYNRGDDWAEFDFRFNMEMDTTSFQPKGENGQWDPANAWVDDDVVSFVAPDGTDLRQWYDQNPQDVEFAWVTPEGTPSNVNLRARFRARDRATGDVTIQEGQYSIVLGPNINALSNGHPMNQDRDLVSGEVPDDRFNGGVYFTTRVTYSPSGYEAVEQPFENIDLEDGAPGVTTLIDNLDDATRVIDLLGNTFNFYGQTYANASIWVSSNGLIGLGADPQVNPNNGDLLRTNQDLLRLPNTPAIAPLWDNWTTNRGADKVLYKFEANRLIVEWSQVPNVGEPTDPVTFQAILELNTGADAGIIVFNYVDLQTASLYYSNGGSATVGIKDATPTPPPVRNADRLLVSFNNRANPYIGSGKAIRISQNGTVTGVVYNDADGNAVRSLNEPGLRGWSVYVDMDNDGVLDPGDPVAYSRSNGFYQILHIPSATGARTRTVREVPQLNWMQTEPVPPGTYAANVAVSPAVTQNLDFGNRANNLPPVIDPLNPVAFSIVEHSPQGTYVGTIGVTDANQPRQTMQFQIISGNYNFGDGHGLPFQIVPDPQNPWQGLLQVGDPAALDYDRPYNAAFPLWANKEFTLTIRITDSDRVNPLSTDVVVTVRLVDILQAPIAVDHAYVANIGQPLVVGAAQGLLAGVIDPDNPAGNIPGMKVEAVLTEAPLFGGLQMVSADGSFVYTPLPFYEGLDTFRYLAVDETGLSSAGVVAIRTGSATQGLTVIVPPKVWEGQEPLIGGGTVRLPAIATYDVKVYLVSGNLSELRLHGDEGENEAPYVWVRAGQDSARFSLLMQDDPTRDGAQRVLVGAYAENYFAAAAPLLVGDNDVDHFVVSYTASQTDGSVIVGQPLPVYVEARDVNDERIEVYDGLVNLAAVGTAGQLPTRIVQGVDVGAEVLLTDGTAAVDMRILLADPSVFIAANDHQGHVGQTGNFVVQAGAGVAQFVWAQQQGSELIPIQDVGTNVPVNVVLEARDQWDNRVVDYTGTVDLSGWVISSQPPAPRLAISEVGINMPSLPTPSADYIELQNVSGQTLDTRGWIVAVNNAENSDPSAADTRTWALPSAVAPGEILYRSDDPGDQLHYWGGNIYWGESTGKGWVMILDAQRNIVDFTAWGYNDYQIKAMTPSIAGQTIHVGSGWQGAGIHYDSNGALSMQRTADRDSDSAGDFTWQARNLGAQNPGLITPFVGRALPVPVAPLNATFTAGRWSGSVSVVGATGMIYLRADDRLGHLGNSNLFVVGESTARPGLYDPAQANFFLRNEQSGGPADQSFVFGVSGLGWVPLVGDWDGNGTKTPGLYDPQSATFFLKNSAGPGPADTMLAYGPANLGWIPLVGDWDGDGQDTLGVYDPVNGAFFLKNTLAQGDADLMFSYGIGGSGWQPLAGDWDGDGRDTVGVYSPDNSVFLLKNTLGAGAADLVYNFGVGGLGWMPLAGNWDGSSGDSAGLYVPETSTFFFRNDHSAGAADVAFSYGVGGLGWRPLVGDWVGPGSALRAAGPASLAAAEAPLNSADVAALAAAAIGRWEAAGLDSTALTAMGQIEWIVTDLGGTTIGMAYPGRIYLDRDAAGHGWFVDQTPGDDAEFSRSADGALTAVDPAAVDRIDLLTVLQHELGHAAGLGDSLDEGLMAGTLGSGIRRQVGPAEIDALFGS